MSEVRERKTSWIPATDNRAVDSMMLYKFISEYGNKYSGRVRVNLNLNLLNGVGSYWNPMEFLQIYSYLNLINKSDDIYYGYYKKFAEAFDINCNILDVACGAVPAFGLIIGDNQMKLPNSRGTITMCDPALVLDTVKNNNMILKKDKFNSEEVKNYDIVTGIMPCSVTRDIISSSCEYNKDFYIGLCGCPQEYDMFDDGKSGIEHNIEYAKEMCYKHGRSLVIDNLDFVTTDNKPIIYSKKRK